MKNARVIKFRLRQGNNIVGYEWATLCPKKGRFTELTWRYSYTNYAPWNTTYIPHDAKDQYTGLKDKNGKEIYEGDILNDNSTGKCRGVVEWGDYGWVCSNQSFRDIGIWEIIGNESENPELLK